MVQRCVRHGRDDDAAAAYPSPKPRNSMAQNRLDGVRVAILVSTDFEQAEMVEPRKALDGAGATTTLISTQPGQVSGMHHDAKADQFKVDLTMDQANPDDFDAVLLPGGALNADQLRMNPKAQQFVRRIDETNRPIAAICHAPWLLVSAGLVNGRTLTSYHTIQDDVRNAGGHWLDEPKVRDRNWVSSRSPKDIPHFNPAMIELFSEYRTGRQQKHAA
jgi:protease I